MVPAPYDGSGPQPPPPGGNLPNAVAYRLSIAKTMASPVPQPTGITYDGRDLWIFGAGSYQTPTLVRFHEQTFSVDPPFTFPGLISGGTLTGGIMWDGTSIWISISGSTNALSVVDPSTGQITRTMSSPAVLGPVDLDFDGMNMWLSSGTGTVFRIDRASGGVLQQFPDGMVRDNGIAWRPGELFVGGLFGGMELYCPAGVTPHGSIVHADGSPFLQNEIGASVFVGNQFVMLSSLGITFYDVIPGP
jgi:hypothetical protein